MVTGEIESEGQQPSELIKKIKENQVKITKNVCSKIIEGFYKEFSIEKDVDEELLQRQIMHTYCNETDGVKEFLICLDYLNLEGVIHISPTTLAEIMVEIGDPTYSLGKDTLLILFSTISQEKQNISKSHYLVSKCLDLCVPF